MNCRKLVRLKWVIISNESFHLVYNQTLVGAAEAARRSPSMTEVNRFLHFKKLKQIEIYLVRLKNISMLLSTLKDIPTRNARAELVFLSRRSPLSSEFARSLAGASEPSYRSHRLQVWNTNPNGNGDLELAGMSRLGPHTIVSQPGEADGLEWYHTKHFGYRKI